MQTDLIITTYNRPDALEGVLVSVMRQTMLPYQVIIADDGSGEATAMLIKRYQAVFPVSLVHAWQEDLGFRAAESRNKALSFVQSEYVVIIDGDLILDVHFIEDHIRYAEPGCFLQGGRALMTEEKTAQILRKPDAVFLPKVTDRGIESRFEKRITAFRATWLADLFKKELKNKSKVRSCNMSFYFKDAVRINGFNNDFVGWGREDSEFVERLLNAGVRGKLIKFVCLGYHLYHLEEPKESLPHNDAILKNTIVHKLNYCSNGLSKFLYNR